MGSIKKYRLNRFKGYSLEDCECRYCLYYPGKNEPCPLPVCCCEVERREALGRECKTKEGDSNAGRI